MSVYPRGKGPTVIRSATEDEKEKALEVGAYDPEEDSGAFSVLGPTKREIVFLGKPDATQFLHELGHLKTLPGLVVGKDIYKGKLTERYYLQELAALYWGLKHNPRDEGWTQDTLVDLLFEMKASLPEGSVRRVDKKARGLAGYPGPMLEEN